MYRGNNPAKTCPYLSMNGTILGVVFLFCHVLHEDLVARNSKLSHLVNKVIMFQGAHDAMAVTPEIFGQLKHINN